MRRNKTTAESQLPSAVAGATFYRLTGTVLLWAARELLQSLPGLSQHSNVTRHIIYAFKEFLDVAIFVNVGFALN